MSATFSTRSIVALLLVASVGGAMAVGPLAADHVPAESTEQTTTYLRVVHASADAPAVDVYLDNDSVVTAASFGDVTDYLPLEAGTYNLTITEAGDREAVVFEGNVTLEPRSPTTVAASGEVMDGNGTFAPRAFTDDPFLPGANDSAIRVVHLSSDAPTVDVTTADGSVVLADNVSFGNASPYMTVPAGNYTVAVREATAADNGTVVATANVSLAGGTAYSAWAIGKPELQADDEPFTVGLTEDAAITVHLPAAATPADNATETPDGTTTAVPTETSTANTTEAEPTPASPTESL